MRAILKFLAGLAGLFTGFMSFVFLLTLPGMLRLPKPGRTTLEGVTTLQDAIVACQSSGLKGWEMVAYAQQLAARKFTYSRRNAWDTPARAFERGMGYCQQQALALQAIYAGLGIPSEVVYTRRAFFPPKVVHGVQEPELISGHTWLRVQIGEEVKDVCSGNPANYPGRVHFVAFSPAQPLTPAFAAVAHLASAIVNALRDMRSGALWQA